MKSAETIVVYPGARERKERDELAFLPAALEIIETPPSPIGRAIALLIMLFFCLALAWASLGTVDIVASAPGKIIPSGRTKVVQPFETGVVRAIHVRDGQSVKAGDVLIELDATMNEAELKHIRGVDAQGRIIEAKVEKKASVPWGVLLRNSNMWAIMLAYFTYVYCLWIFLTWLPSYLVDYRGFTLLKVGFLGSLPLWAGVVGDAVGGLATDWLLRKTGSARIARRTVAITGMLGCCIFIVPAAMIEDAYVAVYCLTASMFFLECTIGPSWAVPMDTGGKYSGTVSGMMNMAGNIGGALSPIVFGVLVQIGNWQAPFIVAAALLVVGSAVWAFWLDPDKHILAG